MASKKSPNAALIGSLKPAKPIPYDPELMQAFAEAADRDWQKFENLRRDLYRRLMPSVWTEIGAAERAGEVERARQLQVDADRRWQEAMGVPPLSSLENLAILRATATAAGFPATDAGLHAWTVASLRRKDDGQLVRVPPEYRSHAMSKAKAARYLRGAGDRDGAVEWLNSCIAEGTIACESLSRQSHVFDVRQFPDSVREIIRPR